MDWLRSLTPSSTPRNPVTLALFIAYLACGWFPLPTIHYRSDWSGRQSHTFLRRNPDMHFLPDPEVEFGLGADPDLALADVDQIVDHFAQEYPVHDPSRKDVKLAGPVIWRLVMEDKILRPRAHQHRLPRRDCLPKVAAEHAVRGLDQRSFARRLLNHAFKEVGRADEIGHELALGM